jgi:hypothetical protein
MTVEMYGLSVSGSSMSAMRNVPGTKDTPPPPDVVADGLLEQPAMSAAIAAASTLRM